MASSGIKLERTPFNIKFDAFSQVASGEIRDEVSVVRAIAHDPALRSGISNPEMSRQSRTYKTPIPIKKQIPSLVLVLIWMFQRQNVGNAESV